MTAPATLSSKNGCLAGISWKTSSRASKRAHAASPVIITANADAIGRPRLRQAKTASTPETIAATTKGMASGLG